MFVDIFLYWLLDIFFPRKKKRKIYCGADQYDYDTYKLLIADSIIPDRNRNHNDDGFPETFNDSSNEDPFLVEDYNDGPNW